MSVVRRPRRRACRRRARTEAVQCGSTKKESAAVPAVSYRLEGEIALLSFANPPVNALSLVVRTGLMERLERAAADDAVRAIVITGVGGTFSSGADINEIASGAALTAPTLRDLQAHMESSRKPLVAAIDGICFGGGFEIALTCHWRVGSRSAKVGLPEVKLGLLPGAGGTQRFTRLAGPAAALEAITSGAPIPAARALELRLVDEVADDAMAAAILLARRAVREHWPLRVTSDISEHLREGTPELFADFRRRLTLKARGQLAPFRIVDAIEAAGTRPKEEAFRYERELFLECRDSPQRKALTHVFFAEREARRIPGLPADTRPLPIRTAAVIGAGTMGGGIAMNFANAGIPVAVLEVSGEALERGLGVIRKNYGASVSRGSLTPARAEQALALIRGVSDYQTLSGADIVIEAVFEDLNVKREVFARLDRVAAPHAILATNTSTLDIDAIAASTTRPAQVVGTHFFSPANVMKLLENVRGRQTSAQTIATVMALGRSLGKIS